MLEFATHYHLAIDLMTAACDLDLLKYKLVPEEWKIAGELRDVLKVSYYYTFHTFTHSKIDFQGHHTLFFMWNNLATVIPAMDDYGSHQQSSCHIIQKPLPVLTCCLCCPGCQQKCY